jgi:hypothetical protein
MQSSGGRDRVTPYKKASDAWLQSEAFQTLSEPTTLGASPLNRLYLENRLRDAFAAGWNARGECTAVETADGIQRLCPICERNYTSGTEQCDH